LPSGSGGEKPERKISSARNALSIVEIQIQNGCRIKMKKFLFFFAFFFLFLNVVFAVSCSNCGKELNGNFKFCPFCGKPQTNRPVSGNSSEVTQWKPLNLQTQNYNSSSTNFQRPAPGSITNSQFLKLFEPLEIFEKKSNLLISDIQSIRTMIQRQILPMIEEIKKKIRVNEIRLTEIQAKLLSLYQEKYSSLLEGGISLGIEKNLAQIKIQQVLVLHDYVRKNLEEADPKIIEKIEEVNRRELADFEDRVVNLNEKAGFQNPGIAYKIPDEGFSAGNGISFSFGFQPRGKKIGDRIYVFDDKKTPLGILNFQKESQGYRMYSGNLRLNGLTSPLCYEVVLEYVEKASFSARWRTQKLHLFVIPHLKKNETGKFSIEAFFGYDPGIPRKKLVQIISR